MFAPLRRSPYIAAVLMFGLVSCANPKDVRQKKDAESERRKLELRTDQKEASYQKLKEALAGAFFTSSYIWLPNCDQYTVPSEYEPATDEALKELESEKDGPFVLPDVDPTTQKLCVKSREA